MHQAPDEPRLDDAWVQYYGGEKLGGVKKLTSIDEDSLDIEDDRDPPGAPELALTSVDEGISQTAVESQPSPPLSAQQTETPALKLQAAPENRSQSTIAPVKDLHRTEKPRAAQITPAPRAVEAATGRAPSIQQSGEAKDVIPPELQAGDARTLADKGSAGFSFETWSKRWAPWLKRGGSIKVCEAFFLMTHAQGKSECFTSNSEIMKRTELSRAQCIRNIHYLIDMGFLDELSEVNNREAKGTYYRFNLVPKSLAGQ